ncbi:MAG TPA: hypothetical protein VHE35_32990 [Kofleriaceae bacterium]|nr:hypothetical protein [Kofleriaceae bacterium]
MPAEAAPRATPSRDDHATAPAPSPTAHADADLHDADSDLDDESDDDEPDPAFVLELYKGCTCPAERALVTSYLGGRTAITEEDFDDIQGDVAYRMAMLRGEWEWRVKGELEAAVESYKRDARRGVTDPQELARIDAVTIDDESIREVELEWSLKLGLKEPIIDVQSRFDVRQKDRQVRLLQRALRENATRPADAYSNRVDLSPNEKASTGWALQGMRPEYLAKDAGKQEFKTRYMFEQGDDLDERAEQERGTVQTDDRNDQVLQFDGRLWRLADGMLADTRDAGQLVMAVNALKTRLGGQKLRLLSEQRALGEAPDPQAAADLDARLARLESRIARADTHHSVNGQYIFVMNAAGQFFAGKGMPGIVHHSSFMAGGAVAAAGEVSIRDGRLLSISNNSGHYQPGPAYLWQAVKQLEVIGAPLDEIMVSVIGVGQRFRSARAFLDAMDPSSDASWFDPDQAILRLRGADKGAEPGAAVKGRRGDLRRRHSVGAPRAWELGRSGKGSQPVDSGGAPGSGASGDVASGHDAQGYVASGYDARGYVPSGYDAQGYDPSGHDAPGHDASGYDASGYNASGYDASGYVPNGYDARGYDASGYDASGYDATPGYPHVADEPAPGAAPAPGYTVERMGYSLGYGEASTDGSLEPGHGDDAGATVEPGERGPLDDRFARRGHAFARRASAPRPAARRRRPAPEPVVPQSDTGESPEREESEA